MNGTTAYPTHSRTIVNGIPYYLDPANNLYTFGIDGTGQRIKIGTYDPTSERATLADNWQELFDERLAAYRAACATTRMRNDPAIAKQPRTKRSTVSKAKASA